MAHDAKSKPEAFWNEDTPEAKAKRFWNLVQQAIERGTIQVPGMNKAGHGPPEASTTYNGHENSKNDRR